MCKLLHQVGGTIFKPTHPLKAFHFHQHKKSCYTTRIELGRFRKTSREDLDQGGVKVNTTQSAIVVHAPLFEFSRPCVWRYMSSPCFCTKLTWILNSFAHVFTAGMAPHGTAASWFKVGSHVSLNFFNANYYFLKMF